MGRAVEPSSDGEGSSRLEGSPAGDTVITSRKNPFIHDLRALLRSPGRRTARCVVEGWRFVDTAAESGAEIQCLVYTPAALVHPRAAEVRERLRASGVRTVTVSPYVFAALTQVETPQGILAVVRRPPEGSFALLRDPRAFLVVLDGVQDPGNVGAILRTAAAAGATGGLLVGGAADPYGPKAIRAAAGTVFHLPLLFYQETAEAAAALDREGVRVVVADPKGERLDSEVPLTRPLALVFGGEGAGTAPAWRTIRATTVRLPMTGAVESLGVAAAAAVLLYTASRAGDAPQG